MKGFVCGIVWFIVLQIVFPVAPVKGLVQTAGSALIVGCLGSGRRVIKDQS